MEGADVFLNDPPLPFPSEDPFLPVISCSQETTALGVKDEIFDDCEEVKPIANWDEDTSNQVEFNVGPSVSWNDFTQSLLEHGSIREFTMSDAPNPDPPPIEGVRKKYQRFREKKFVCDECDRCFTLKQNVQQHLVHYHLNGNRQVRTRRGKRFKCLKCDQVFKTLEQAQRHDATKHGDKAPSVKVFRCEQCAKVYPSKSQLKEHVEILHMKLRPFECSECGLSFGRKGGLRRHMLMVHQNHLFKCPVEGCDHPGYKCTKALTAHIRSVHTKDRPYVCMLCEKSFVRKNDLKTHEMTHSTTAPLECDSCGKTFKRTLTLNAHKKKCKKP